MYRRGLISGEDKSKEHYSAALTGFLKTEKDADTMKPYLQYRIGRMYYDGYGTERDYKEAFKWLELSAKGGNHLSEFTVAKMYMNGIGTEKDLREAAAWYEKAEAENTYAAYELGRLYSSDDKAIRNTDKAIKFLGKAAKSGNADAAYRLSVIYFDDSDKEHYDGERAIDCFNRAAKMYKEKSENGNHSAELSLGRIYAHKEFPAYNVDLSEKWLLKAAESGEDECAASAEYALGKLYMSDDVKRYRDAIKWLTLSFEHKNNHAAFAMAKILSNEDTRLLDRKSALEWLKKAEAGAEKILFDNPDIDKTDFMNRIKTAEKSLDLRIKFEASHGENVTEQIMKQIQNSRLPEAEYNLGRLYLSDECRDYKLAEEHLLRAAVLQNQYAMLALAKLYIKGDIPKNHSAAIQLLGRAKEVDESIAPFADYTIGAMYLFDNEIRDRELAEKHLKLSAQAGNEYAQKLLKNDAAWREHSVMNLVGSVMKMLETNARDGELGLPETAAAIFGRGDLSKEAIAELIYKMQDKHNTAEM